MQHYERKKQELPNRYMRSYLAGKPVIAQTGCSGSEKSYKYQ